MPDDPRIATLRRLIDEATALQEHAARLVAEITDQLQRSIWIHDDRADGQERPRRRERRKRPRS
jgi:hypothetical protein